MKVIVDGSVVQSETADGNDGRCVPVPGRDAYTWAYQVPCKTSLGGRTYSLNTATLADGEHHIQVIIEDAAGNQSVVLDRTVQVKNTTEAPATSTPATAGAGASPGAPGELDSSTQLGAPNGIGASETSQLELHGGAHVARTFAGRALTLSGALRGASGSPIAGATLDVREQAQDTTTAAIIGHTTTAANGDFTVHVGAGPSRLLSIGYRAFSTDAAYSAQATVAETVSAGVQMHITPLRTSAAGTIEIAGQVEGPIPHGGVLVELLVHYRGAWVPFRTPRTNAAGRFKTAYQFEGATGGFPFRAEIPAGQAGFPYGGGYSNTITVRSG